MSQVLEQFKVTGMDCTSCATTIQKHLTKQGLQQVQVNFANGTVSYLPTESIPQSTIKKEIEKIGYTVEEEKTSTHKRKFLSTYWQKFLVCLVFALPLFIGHLVHVHWLMNAAIQLTLSLPVYIIGMNSFGKSAIKSIAAGLPNMNVLIALGATAAMGYSLYNYFLGAHDMLFFETAATTITLVFLGNYLEDKSIASTQTAINNLTLKQTLKANMIAFDNEFKEQIFEVEASSLRVGDLLLLKTGDQVPADCKILWGSVLVNESIITGESLPVEKKEKDILVGGSTLTEGTAKAQVTAVGKDAVINHIQYMVQQAQNEKPPMQQLADKISAVFVPVVIAIAVGTLLINFYGFNVSFKESLLRSIAVLVIACPCAMGLATPAAIAVGLGRAAQNGLLFKNAKSLENFKDIKYVVFDKTGTLTNGKFSITHFFVEGIDEDSFKQIAYSLEKFSNHPIALGIVQAFKTTTEIKWKTIKEEKGIGIFATAKEGDMYSATNYKHVQHLTAKNNYQVYITKNNVLIGAIAVDDTLRPEAKNVITYLQQKNIQPILLSGDSEERCQSIATQIGITNVYASQKPADKLAFITKLNTNNNVVMVGDGINDAPALAKATVGVSIGNASNISLQAADVILLKGGLQNLPLALGLGKHTFITIKENLFWALGYNVVAIPVAAIGLLGVYGPTYGALIMGLSDVVLALNSLRLRFKKVV